MAICHDQHYVIDSPYHFVIAQLKYLVAIEVFELQKLYVLIPRVASSITSYFFEWLLPSDAFLLCCLELPLLTMVLFRR